MFVITKKKRRRIVLRQVKRGRFFLRRKKRLKIENAKRKGQTLVILFFQDFLIANVYFFYILP